MMEDVKDVTRVILSIVALIVVVGALAFVTNAMNLVNFSFFAPKIQQVQTDTFKSGQAYQDGMANDLADLQIKYMTATDPAVKDSIRSIIKQRFASYDSSKLPQNLQIFLNSL
jgi:hypothetical protein